jgi:Xaa-Pro aminopeptidase
MMSEHNQRLVALRSAFAAAGLDGFVIPRGDEHLGEYVPDSAARLAYISGFTGSAGLAVVLADRAAVWSDGRYVLQLAQQTDASLWERLHITETKPEAWLRAHAADLRIGYDPWLISAEALAKFEGLAMVPVLANPVDAIWAERPAPPMGEAVPYDEAFAGESSLSKRGRVAAQLREAGHYAAIITDPASVAWLFNIRGSDLEFCPVALGFAIIYENGMATLFMPGEKVSPALRTHLGAEVEVAEREELAWALEALTARTVRYDPATQPVWFKTVLQAAGATMAEAPDPCLLPKAIKNEAEQAGSRAAHLRDGLAVTRFLHWLGTAAPAGGQTELSAGARLLAERRQANNFRGESFSAISGAGPNGAIIHYHPTPESDRPIAANEVYLIDSGGQYLEATTDITRTIWTGPAAPPADVRAKYTAVLAGHIELARLVFPEGIAGAHIDAFARAALWREGLDYDHGTGHGIGAYLSVHEGPAGISRAARPVPLAPGMILSNEPGYYEPGAYGMRLENLVLVQRAEAGRNGRKFLQFETLTLAPFDRTLIDPAGLSAAALAWLNAYHARVHAELAPHLPEDVRAWLAAVTAPIFQETARKN